MNPIKRILLRAIGQQEDPPPLTITPFLAKEIHPRMEEMDRREQRMRTNAYERAYLPSHRKEKP